MRGIFLLLLYGPSLASFSFYFCLSKQTIKFLQQYKRKNVHPEYGAGIRTPRPWEHEPPRITTIPGSISLDATTPPTVLHCLQVKFNFRFFTEPAVHSGQSL